MTAASVGFHCPECLAEGRKTTRVARTVYGGRVRSFSGRVGPVTGALIGINVVMFIVTSAGGGLSLFGNGGSSSLFLRLALNPAAVGHGEWYRMVTAMFLHFNLLHIASNMYALYLIGPSLEAALGRSRFLALYFLAGVGGSALSVAFGPMSETAAGASGAIFGLFAAFYVVARHQRLQTGGIAGTIVINLVFSLTFRGVIDWRGHVGGLIAGGLVMVVFAYAPRGRRRNLLQAAGVAATAVLVVGVGLVGVHRAHKDCPVFSASYLDSGYVETDTGCPIAPPGFSQ
jgi:membrane associated rhomboid family serine protease